jgi:uncharacterized membrane protein
MEHLESIPQPHEITTREREQSLAAYLMMFATAAAGLPLPFLNLVASFAYYYFTRSTSRFVRFHSFQSLISQFPISLMNGAAVFWGFRILFFDASFSDLYKGYLAVVVLANFVYVVFSLIAAIKAYKGRMFYFLFFGRVAYLRAFDSRLEVREAVSHQNHPPRL